MKHAPKKAQSARPVRRGEKRAITVICIVLAAIMIGLGGYAAGWYANRARIRQDAGRYRAMYSPGPAVTAVPTPMETPEPEPTLNTMKPEAPAIAPDFDTALPTAVPVETAEPVPVDDPLPTPNAETRVYTLPSAPPVQPSFDALLAHNGDTVGFLDIEDVISLPVVQRENDNDFYLTHNFDGKESPEGALFLDGVNRLVPEDACLIVYGHNMKNGTMFGDLDEFEALKYLRRHPIVRFDTLYENRLYTPFAAFTASMNPDDDHYFDVRQFTFDDAEFELFALKMQTRTRMDLPVSVRPGDRLLLLVTCDYTNKQGRFILGLRQLRPGETEADIRRLYK